MLNDGVFSFMQFLTQYWILSAINSLVLYSDGNKRVTHARTAPNMSAPLSIGTAQSTEKNIFWEISRVVLPMDRRIRVYRTNVSRETFEDSPKDPSTRGPSDAAAPVFSLVVPVVRGAAALA